MTCRYNSGHGRGDELAIALPGTVIVRGDNVAVVSQVCVRRCKQTSARGARASERARAHAKGAGFWASALVTQSALRARERRQCGEHLGRPRVVDRPPAVGVDFYRLYGADGNSMPASWDSFGDGPPAKVDKNRPAKFVSSRGSLIRGGPAGTAGRAACACAQAPPAAAQTGKTRESCRLGWRPRQLRWRGAVVWRKRRRPRPNRKGPPVRSGRRRCLRPSRPESRLG